jgi:hypothetical protein
MAAKIRINGIDLKPLPPLERLLSVFSYNPDTGVLSREGRTAGSVNKAGYRYVTLDGEKYLAHRIIWKMVKGYDPTFVDHDDLDSGNNRWGNLRSCDRSDNQCNHGVRVDNICGYKGIHYDERRKRWVVQVQKMSVRFHRRTRTLAAAIALYRLKSGELHGEFSRVA